jgi:hypothetical protein
MARSGTWTLSFASLPSTSPNDLSVLRGNADCELTVTSLKADKVYNANPPLLLSGLFARTPSTFVAEGSSITAFYGNALVAPATYSSPFTVAFEVSDDPAVLSAGRVPGSYAGPSSSKSSIAVSPATQVADGISSIAATVTARAFSGKALAGSTVTLSFSGTAVVTPAKATTNALGQAVFQVYAGAPTTGVLTANVTGVAVTQSPQITFVDICSLGETKCGAYCVNLTSDSSHCGACGQACPSGQVCRTGSCQWTCASGSTQCRDQCVTLGDDIANCGACNNTCASGSTCASGTCVAVVTIDPIGCADRTREAFTDAIKFPKIAGARGPGKSRASSLPSWLRAILSARPRETRRAALPRTA